MLLKSADYRNAPMEKMSWNVFIGVVLGQIVSSYTLGIVGVALDRVPSSMTLSSTWLGLLGAGSLIGLFGSLLVGRLADRYGRRKFFMADMLALTLLSVLQLFTTNLAALLVIRIALGMAIAVEYTVGTALLMEWVPAKRYFRYQTYLLAYWAIGYFAAYLVGIFTTGFGDRTWQVILASSAIVSTLAGLQRLVVRQPESPRWLASKGRIIEAINLVHRYVGEDYTVHPAPQVEVKKGAWRMLFSKKIPAPDLGRRALLRLPDLPVLWDQHLLAHPDGKYERDYPLGHPVALLRLDDRRGPRGDHLE